MSDLKKMLKKIMKNFLKKNRQLLLKYHREKKNRMIKSNGRKTN